MKKRVLGFLLTAVMAMGLFAGCGPADTGSTDSSTATTETTDSGDSTPAASTGKRVAVAMPTQSSERWINDGSNMKDKLEALGYEVDLQYAEDDVQAQVSQIENMIAAGADCLVIAAVDSSALVNVEAQAKDAGIPIIAYDRLLMDTDAVSYYATFDNKGVGKYSRIKVGRDTRTWIQTAGCGSFDFIVRRCVGHRPFLFRSNEVGRFQTHYMWRTWNLVYHRHFHSHEKSKKSKRE